MSSTKICQDVRFLLLARSTQLMLTDAIIGLVAKGVYLSAKHNVLSSADKVQLLKQLDNTVGIDDITEAVEPLRFRYEFVNKFGEVRRGQMSQLIRATLDRAASDRASRKDLMLLKDYSFIFRELAPLFEILREARNYFSHNTSDREDIGWNGLIISAITRILERGNFLDKKRVEERANLRTKTTDLFNQLANAHTEEQPTRSPLEKIDSIKHDTNEARFSNPTDVVEIIDRLSSNQDELMLNARSVESQLSSISKQIETLKISTRESVNSQGDVIVTQSVVQQSSSETPTEIGVSEKPAVTSNTHSPDKLIEETDLEDNPVLANEILISVDKLYEKLQSIKDKIRRQYESDSRWRGPSSNILQRAIITAIVTNEPNNIDEILKYDDVKWRVKKEQDLLNEQVKFFGDSINELLTQTAWAKDYQQ